MLNGGLCLQYFGHVHRELWCNLYTPNGFEPLWVSIAILWPIFLGVQCRWVGLDVPWWQRLHGRWSQSSPKLFNKSWGLLSMTYKMEVYKHTEKGLSRPCVCVLSFWAMAIKTNMGIRENTENDTPPLEASRPAGCLYGQLNLGLSFTKNRSFYSQGS